MKKLIDAILLASIIVALLVFLERLSSAALGGPAPTSHVGQAAPAAPRHPERDISRIVTVLTGRIGDAGLPPEARNKLSTMHDEDFRLVTSLCDRIAGAGNEAGADVALVLVTALIVFT